MASEETGPLRAARLQEYRSCSPLPTFARVLGPHFAVMRPPDPSPHLPTPAGNPVGRVVPWPLCRNPRLPHPLGPNPLTALRQRMFYGVASDTIRLLAFETPFPTQSLGGGGIPATPKPLSPYPQSLGLEDYCYTSSVLDRAVTITPSWGKIGGMHVIRGLLLRHQSGAYETSCVGEVRLDSLDHPLLVEATIWLGFSETPMGGPSVTHVKTCRPPPKAIPVPP